MILCDIGNSNVDFFHDGKIWSMSLDAFESYKAKEKIYFISVNDRITAKLQDSSYFINLEPYFNLDTIYQGLGIDRISACCVIKDGIVVDAGTAITVDIVSNYQHLGGFILPGLASYEKTFAGISDRLKFRLNPNIELDALPQRTADALSYGVIKPILMIIKETSKEKRIYFTGGDGQFFSKYFENSIYDRSLIFRGMKKIIEENLC
ncbi:type III pantothenate kinase [Sulfurospirillum sp. 1612]|uniref:type III pantothenate kinase n=1 Tax=Sulfurospirillum sp. 1612 TaxID=3094835 RepID=UPI002F92B620